MKAATVFSDVLLGLAVLLVLASAVGVLVMPDAYLSHATIRAIRVREKGDWRLGGGGKAPGTERER